MTLNPRTIALHKAVKYWSQVWRIPVEPARTKFECQSSKWMKRQIQRFQGDQL
jgi:hypothetical protein